MWDEDKKCECCELCGAEIDDRYEYLICDKCKAEICDEEHAYMAGENNKAEYEFNGFVAYVIGLHHKFSREPLIAGLYEAQKRISAGEGIEALQKVYELMLETDFNECVKEYVDSELVDALRCEQDKNRILWLAPECKKLFEEDKR